MENAIIICILALCLAFIIKKVLTVKKSGCGCGCGCGCDGGSKKQNDRSAPCCCCEEKAR